MKHHLPNALTITRIALTPLLIVLLFRDSLGAAFWALVLFVALAISDYYDGKLARQYSVSSRLGQFLDPLADKVLVLGTFVVLTMRYPEHAPWWGVALIAARDLAVTALRTWAESRGRSIATSYAAKVKTTVQLTYLIFFLVVLTAAKMPAPIEGLGVFFLETPVLWWMMLITVASTLWTGYLYFANLDSSAASS